MMTLKSRRPWLAALLAAGALLGQASDEIPGRVADLLTAIREKSLGKVYDVSAELVVPPSDAAPYFVIRDRTGTVAVRRGMDWPSATFKAGDTVRVRCEIGATTQIPAGAFYADMTLVARNPAFRASKNLFVRTAGDEFVEITGLPTFLTPLRVAIALAALVLLICLIFLWNAALRAVITRKSKSLIREERKHRRAEIKTAERTRLAVELHDSLAQELTAVSLEIDTALKMSDDASATLRERLRRAARILKSSRDELRNCLWDLRNHALESRTMDEAIRLTLTPHVTDVAVDIRFDVPRPRLPDNTAHTVLRIVRELSLNAIRHGAATRIQIAGCLRDGCLTIRVNDNGGGFDPATARGFAEGHFGLLGIRERLDAFGGSLTLASEPGAGCRATINLPLPSDKAATHEDET